MAEFNSESLVQAHLRDLKPYQPHLYQQVIHLEANENPYPFPEAVEKEIYANISKIGFSRYPNPTADSLRNALAQDMGLTKEYFMCGAGSDEIIHTLFLAFTGNNTNVVISVPTFGMYKISAIIAGSKPVEIPLLANYRLDMDRLMVEAEKEETRIIMICSPNNPTGNLVPLEEIEVLCQKAKGLVVVDEAYFEFGQQTALGLLNKYQNLIILRTFSKAYGLAGLRVGYMIANPQVTAQAMKIKQPYNLNSFSQVAAETVLQYKEVFQPTIALIMENQKELGQQLASFNSLYVYPSDCNYFLVKLLKNDAKEIHAKLIEKGVLTRYLGNDVGIENCLRISVGTKEENACLLEKLKECLV